MVKKKHKAEITSSSGQIPQAEPQQLRRVVIATPALTGEVHVLYMHSLVDSIKVCLSQGIELFPISLTNESILPMARNELIALAYNGGVESMVFIDSDQGWNPFALLDIINSPHDVIGLPVPDKTDEPGRFNVRIHDPSNIPVDEAGNILVTGIGTGFIKLSNKVLEALWNSNPSIEFRGKPLKLICEYLTNYNEFVGEDICLSNKVRELGFDIWVNPNYTCSHIGKKTWGWEFSHFLDYIRSHSQQQIDQTEE